MRRELGFGRRGPARGRARSLVVLLHGYGADGADLLGLADWFAPDLPATAFIAPDAPERSGVNPSGFQWFPIPWLDGAPAAAAAAGLVAAAADLDAFLDARLAEEGLVPAALALLGFSQGTMMALHVAPRRTAPVAAVVGFSGRLLGPATLAGEARSRPPVLLVHGDADPVVPPEALPEAAAALAEAGFAVETHVSHGIGHGIAPDGLAAALAFLKARLPG